MLFFKFQILGKSFVYNFADGNIAFLRMFFQCLLHIGTQGG
nr:MAG TPA: hypothetical protein [Caudoviricetes sp.]